MHTSPPAPSRTSADDVPFPQVGQILRHNDFDWKVERCIYSGPFSDVFIVSESKQRCKKYAMKVERITGIVRPVLKLDAHVLPQLNDIAGFPQMTTSGRTANFKYCVMQLVGPDLSKLRKVMQGGKFSLATALNIGLQTLSSLEHLHNKGWLCRDVKAPNLAAGRGTDSGTIYMLDFGFARRFLNADGCTHRRRRRVAPLLGTMPYASLAAHSRKEQCPRDDVESWLYMLIEFVLGNLPWSYLPRDTMREYKNHIRKDGQEEFFAQLPSSFLKMMNCIDSTRFFDRPCYGDLRFLLNQAAAEARVNLHDPLDWVSVPALYAKAEKLGDDVSEVPCAAEKSERSAKIKEDVHANLTASEVDTMKERRLYGALASPSGVSLATMAATALWA